MTTRERIQVYGKALISLATYFSFITLPLIF